MNRSRLCFSLSIVCLLLWTASVTGMYRTELTRELQVDCFDLRGSLINNIECTETEHSYFGLPYNSPIFIMIGIITMILFFTGLVLMSFSLDFKINDAPGEQADV